MNFNIQGKYTFKIPITTMFINSNMLITGHNIITGIGESFFMNRCINDTFNPIDEIVIGNGINAPQKSNDKLDNETSRSSVITSIDNTNKQLILKTSFTVEEIKGTTEIGVLAKKNGEDLLISRDVFIENETSYLNDEFLTGVTGSMEIEYIFQFSTSHIKTGWEQETNYPNVYSVLEPNTVIGVYENTTGNGYKKGHSLTDLTEVTETNNGIVDSTKATFYYDSTNQRLYVKTSKASNPENEELIVQTK